MDAWLLALKLVLDPTVLLTIVFSSLFGLFVGAVPGLTATMATALLVPITFFLSPIAAVAAIVTATAMAIFAGDIPGCLMRIPGTPASAAYVNDSYNMTRKGHAETALGIGLVFSVIGGIFGTLVLTFTAPALADIALKFSSFEYFWLVLLGLSCAVFVTSDQPLKGAITLFIGLLFGSVGLENPAAHPRFTFGLPDLLGGLSLIPAMIGLFAVSEVLRFAQFGDSLMVISKQVGGVLKGMGGMMRKYWRQTVRGSVLGTVIGALPGAGADIAAWMSYAMSKKLSKEPEKFGTGHPEGLVESGAANNSALASAWIPALVFGIPGDSITAIAIGVLYMKDMNPGPTIFVNNPQNVYAVFLLFLMANLIMLPLGMAVHQGRIAPLANPAQHPDADHPAVLHRRRVRDQQRDLRHLDPARLRPAGLVSRGPRLPDRPDDPGHAARDDAGGAFHPFDDQGRRQPAGLRRAPDRCRARDLHRCPLDRIRLGGDASAFGPAGHGR